MSFFKKSTAMCLIGVCALTGSIFANTSNERIDNNQTEINQDNEIMPRDKIYILNSYRVINVASFDYNIELTNQQKYGKVYYSNNTSEPVTLYVKGNGVNKSITIPKNSSSGITWEKKGLGNQKYITGVQSNGKVILNGYYSLANNSISFNN